MNIQVRPAEYRDVEAMRGLYRQELNCQIISDSFLSRGLADPYLILVEGRVSGYGRSRLANGSSKRKGPSWRPEDFSVTTTRPTETFSWKSPNRRGGRVSAVTWYKN